MNRKDTMPDKTTLSDEHRKRHQQLHKAFCELIDDFMSEREYFMSEQQVYETTTLLELRKWSWKQAQGEMENE